MNSGFVQLKRDIVYWNWFKDIPVRLVLEYLLLKANFSDGRFKDIELHRGQVVSGRKRIADDNGLSEQQVRTALKKLESNGEITIKATNRFSVITISNYEDYVDCTVGNQPTNNQQITNQQPTTNQQSTNNQPHNNNEYNDNKENILEFSDENSLSDKSDPKSELPNGVSIDYEALVKFFNDTLTGSQSIIPKLVKITARRKTNINARCREYGKKAIFEAIVKAAKSDFLNGKNNKGWIADFDWIFRPNNFPKVFEGNYDNHETNANGSRQNTENGSDKRRGVEITATSAKDYEGAF